MAFRPLTEAECGQANPLSRLTSHVTHDHTFADSHGQVLQSGSDQLVEQFLQETRRCHKHLEWMVSVVSLVFTLFTTSVIDLMREMHEIESQKSAVPPIPASTIKDQLHDNAWHSSISKMGKRSIYNYFEVKNKSKQRDVAHQSFINNRNEVNWQIYRNYRNEVQKKQQYYYNKIDTYKHNSVKIWKTLKTLINTKNVSSNIRSIQFDIEGDIKEIKDDTNIAEQFNVYFIESIKDIINNIDTVNNWNDNIYWNNNVNIQSKFDEFKLINLCDLITNMNHSLSQIQTYLNINKLKLNVEKSKAMILTTTFKYNSINFNDINVKINDKMLEVVTEFKYLGFMLDNHLTLNSHFHYIYKKISKKIYFFSRISNSLSSYSAITVYNTIILPHFDYCASLMYSFNKK
ncbi:hypothetical protein NQ318_015650 [Aromia moschata]|uniref:Reverse transcriptase N-terminal domain-containing protein n=1 Tax=Aromia moschata TaxID=1265417 RepID=A0AAV8XRG1_9CUCU|nr:hypothetical protein NQ318_015650 [Aromia moschata]